MVDWRLDISLRVDEMALFNVVYFSSRDVMPPPTTVLDDVDVVDVG